MPLLLCPNDNGAMQTVDRAGVQFDMCPTCRGVWLDRGELEKLMAAGAETTMAMPQADTQRARPVQQTWNPGYGERGERGEGGERGEYGDHGGHRRKRGSIFDIFD
jgi:uncharacterized protein